MISLLVPRMETGRNDDRHDEDALRYRYVDGDDFVRMRKKGEQLETTSDEVNGHFRQKKKMIVMDSDEDCIHLQHLGTTTWNVVLIGAMLERKQD